MGLLIATHGFGQVPWDRGAVCAVGSAQPVSSAQGPSLFSCLGPENWSSLNLESLCQQRVLARHLFKVMYTQLLKLLLNTWA